MTYYEWLKEQTPERQQASIAHLRICQRYGEAQRESPNSEETEELRRQIVEYYGKWNA